jgi:hypothetical protein
MPDDQQVATTQPALSGAFNQVSPKIIKLSDLAIQIEAFKQINDNGMLDKLLIDAELRAAGQKAMKSDGKSIYVDSNTGWFGTPSVYVDSRFVTDTVAEFRNNPALTAQQRAFIDKLDDTIEQAVQACPDQTPKLKAGVIKPFKK